MRIGTDVLRPKLKNLQAGFTLIELISILVILSVLAAVLLPRYIDAETSAKMRAIDMGISEMNGRETLAWALVKLSDGGYINDQALWTRLRDEIGTNVGADYDWTTAPNINGGTLRFKLDITAPLTRSESSIETPARWRRL